MREGIATVDRDSGEMIVDLKSVIGRGYARGWFTNCHDRYRLFKGARNTKKSFDMIGVEPIIKILSDDRRNIVVVRKNDVDNRQSTFANIVGKLYDMGFSVGNRMGMKASFIISTNPLQIVYQPTGQKIVFRGMNDVQSIASITFEHGYLTDIYVEEAYEIESYQDFRILDGSLRGKVPGITLQITLCFNAWSQDTWLYEEFFRDNLEDDYKILDDPDRTFMDRDMSDWIGPYGKGLYLHISTYKINEFRDREIYDRSAEEMKQKAPEIYRVEFLGMWGNATGATYPEFMDHESSIVVQPMLLTGKDEKGIPRMSYNDYSIGIDTGLSTGEGKKIIVTKDQDPNDRVKSATTISLNAITSDFSKMITLDEWFYSRQKAYRRYNTDTQEDLDTPTLTRKCVRIILGWVEKYKETPLVMKGTINIFVDSADVGFRENLDAMFRESGIYNVRIYASTKLSIQSRVDFFRLMMGLDDYLISSSCPNAIREYKASKKGEKGEARQDGNDHEINSIEYSMTPLLSKLRQFKTYKLH